MLEKKWGAKKSLEWRGNGEGCWSLEIVKTFHNGRQSGTENPEETKIHVEINRVSPVNGEK
jgi:hypothetical protein